MMDDIDYISIPDVELETETPAYICQTCSTTFTRKDNLANHIRVAGHFIHNKTVPFLKTVLPMEPPYFVCGFKKQDDDKFWTKIRLPDMKTAVELHDWIQRFMKLNNCVYVRRRYAEAPPTITFKATYSCQHYHPVMETKRTTKGTKCRSTIYGCIRNGTISGTTIIVKYNHNHPVASEKTLRFRKPTQRVFKIFEEMYHNGLQPVEALRCYKNHIRLQISTEDYLSKLVNRSEIPDYNWVNHVFRKVFKPQYDSNNRASMQEVIQAIAENDEQCAISILEDGEYTIAIMTELMRRISQTSFANEILFIDPIGSVDAFGMKVYLLITRTSVGEMLVGVVATTNEAEEMIQNGFKLYLNLVDERCFGNQGKSGPGTVMTDEVTSCAIRQVLPSAQHYLCHSHTLRAIYKWLHLLEEDVSIDERNYLYNMLKNMVYAVTEDDLENVYTHLQNLYCDRPRITSFLKRFFGKKLKWALCNRMHIPVRGSDSNSVERGLRMLKEQILNCLRTRSPVKLIKFLTEEFDKQYSKKLLVAGHDKLISYDVVDSGEYSIVADQNLSLYYMQSNVNNETFLVNADTRQCSCIRGLNGGFCEHQQILASNIEIKCEPLNGILKEYLYYLATGELRENMPLNICHPSLSGYEELVEEVFVDEIEYNENINFEQKIQSNDILEAAVPNDEVYNEISILVENLNELVDSLRSDPHRYFNEVSALNRRLQDIKTPEARLSVLFNLDK